MGMLAGNPDQPRAQRQKHLVVPLKSERFALRTQQCASVSVMTIQAQPENWRSPGNSSAHLCGGCKDRHLFSAVALGTGRRDQMAAVAIPSAGTDNLLEHRRAADLARKFL